MKENMDNDYIRKVKSWMRSKVNVRNLVRAIDNWTVLLLYIGQNMKWQILTRTGKGYNVNEGLHSTTDKIRLYLHKEEDVRGLISVEISVELAIIEVDSYVVISVKKIMKNC